MTIQDLLNHTSEWLIGTGPHSDLVISSRVRLARNMEGIPFSHRAKKTERERLVTLVDEVAKGNSYLKKGTLIKLNELTSLDRLFLAERHLISREHARGEVGRAVIFEEKEMISIMINEEDHLRLQVIHSGLQLPEAWRLIDKIDEGLEAELDYAFSEDWGYLTACPTNVGTGMRASVLIHLPGLALTKQIHKILQATNRLGLAVRGLYGEGSEAVGDFYQISNQVTLGHLEAEIIDNVDRLTKQIIDQERKARSLLLREEKERVEDKVWRAHGLLKSAHIICFKEAMDHLSSVRLGIDLGLITNIDLRTVNELMILIQPAHVQKIEGRELKPPLRDIKRADLIRERFR